MVSIVLPTYNGENSIEEAIISILTQTYQNFELIIVNDCSTDTTRQIIEKYIDADSRIKVINNIKNRKLPASLNIGFSNCQGDYYTWTSDDNILKSNMIEHLIKVLENTDADLVYAKSEYINQEGKIMYESDEMLLENIDNLYFTNIIGACFLYKASLHNEIRGYDEQKFLVEDYDFWLRAKHNHKFLYVPEVLYQYRVHENSLSSQKKSIIMEMTIELWEREILNNYIPERLLLKIYTNIVYFCYDINDMNRLRYYMRQIKRISLEDYKNLGLKVRMCKYLNKEVAVSVKKYCLRILEGEC